MPLPPYAKLAPRPLKPEALSLEGLTKRQIETHFAVYAGEISRLNEVHRQLQGRDITDPAQLADLKVAQARLFNAIKLHEAYFEGLSANATVPDLVIRLLERDFGSYYNWRKEFSSLGATAEAWVVLAFDRDDCRLHNFASGNGEGLWNAVPVLVMDVNDHAYAIDHPGDRPLYVEALLTNVDWGFVERTVSRLVRD